jgi:hypothetical protein
LIHNKKARFIENPNLYLQLFTNSFERLATGIEMYCAALNKTVKVFAFVHSVYGDLPGRCEIAGLKSSIMAHRYLYMISWCLITYLNSFFI